MKFNTIGIICEYNPFHFGHLYHINEAKKISGCENVVCIMSGSVVQRGDVAIFDKWERTRQAVENGADLVIELPATYSLQSADVFAYGAVNILHKLGVVDALCFGAETDDLSVLSKCAEFLADPTDRYKQTLKAQLSSGMGYPAACEYALRTAIGNVPEEVFSPNSTLAIAYLKSLILLDSKIKPYCIKRNNDYHSDVSLDGFKSATAVRDMIFSGADYSKYAPEYCDAPKYHLRNAESYILGFFRNVSDKQLENIAGFEDGLGNLLRNSAKKACTLDELFSMCTGKRYTISRIRRFCLCAILGITKTVDEPDYIRILGFSSSGTKLIKKIKEQSPLIPVTKTADYKGSPMFDSDIRSTDFASLCCDIVGERYCGKDFLKSPYVKHR